MGIKLPAAKNAKITQEMIDKNTTDVDSDKFADNTNTISNDPTVNPCAGCAACCKYVAVEIDKPTSKTDYHNIIWYLLHKNVVVWQDDDSDWYVEFKTPCEALTPEGWCGVWENRPKVCKDYSPKNCTKWGEGSAYKLYFNTAKEFTSWLESRGVDWKFAYQKEGKSAGKA